MSHDSTSWADAIGLWVFLLLIILIAILLIDPLTIGTMIRHFLDLIV